METECILCGGCADICPVDCIEILPLTALAISQNAFGRIAGWRDTTLRTDQRYILIHYRDLCIRCGLCVKRCPVGTFVLEE